MEDDAAMHAVQEPVVFLGKSDRGFESYEPRLFYFCEWLKQLFGESEGKQGKGIFPAALQFSTDLHSMGHLQDGHQIFETIHVEEPPEDLTVPESAGDICRAEYEQGEPGSGLRGHGSTS